MPLTDQSAFESHPGLVGPFKRLGYALAAVVVTATMGLAGDRGSAGDASADTVHSYGEHVPFTELPLPAAGPTRLSGRSLSAGFLKIPSPRAPERTAGTEVTVGSIPLTLAPGWHIAENNRKEKFLFAVNSSDNVAYSLQEASFKPGTPVEDVLNRFYQKVAEKMTNVQTGEPYDPEFTGERFQESQAMQFSGDQQTNRGTAVHVGVMAVLLNSETGQVGLIKLWAHDPDILEENMEDAVAMTSSTLD